MEFSFFVLDDGVEGYYDTSLSKMACSDFMERHSHEPTHQHSDMKSGD
jgi:hypothetical protein